MGGHRQASRQAGKQASRQAGKQASRQAIKQQLDTNASRQHQHPYRHKQDAWHQSSIDTMDAAVQTGDPTPQEDFLCLAWWTVDNRLSITKHLYTHAHVKTR